MNKYVLTGLGGKIIDEVWAKSFDGARRSFVRKYKGKHYIIKKKNFDFAITYL
jgi:hypothetical protein